MNGAEILDAKGKPAEDQAKPAEEQGPKPAAQLIVTMFEDGRVQVTGAIANKTLAYGLLEVAKDIVRQYVDQANAPRVATPQQPGFFRSLLGKHSHVSAKR